MVETEVTDEDPASLEDEERAEAVDDANTEQ